MVMEKYIDIDIDKEFEDYQDYLCVSEKKLRLLDDDDFTVNDDLLKELQEINNKSIFK